MLKKIIVSVFILIFVVINFTGCTEEKKEENNHVSVLYVDDSGGADYTTIQDAIRNVEVGGTIYVRNGNYKERVIISKTVNLIADGDNTVRIYYINFDTSSDFNSVVTISADNCTFTGFEISFSYFASGVKGIYVTSSNNKINFCNFSNVYHGIFLDNNSKNNIISNCTISGAKRNIYLNRSEFNIISNNNLIFSGLHSLYMYASSNNIIFNNRVADNDYGFLVQGSDNNKFFNNNFKNNSVGLKFCCGSEGNVVYSNNFIQSSLYNGRDDMNNQWDNGTIGNYWDDYIEVCPDAKQVGNMWDTPYKLVCKDDTRCGTIVDRFPLVSFIDFL